MSTTGEIKEGDALSVLKGMSAESVDCIITSPPYWGLRDYGHESQIGLEKTPQEFVRALAAIFEECRRVLKPEGTMWVNIGDSYASFRDSKSEPDSLRGPSAGTKVPMSNNRNPANLRAAGLKHKDLCGVPWRLAFALQDAGWYLRQDIIWSKPNPMPESVKDRCTKAHEYVFLLTKNEKYYYDAGAIAETAVSEHSSGNGFAGRQGGAEHMPMSGGEGTEEQWQPGGLRNRRSVWEIATRPYKDAHFATFPTALVEPMVLAGSARGGGCVGPIRWLGDHRRSCSKAGASIHRHRT